MSSSNVDISAEPLDRAAPPPYARAAADVAAALETDPAGGLTTAEAASRLARYGPNKIAGEKPPSIQVATLTQLQV